MSRWIIKHRVSRRNADDGFTLIEVLVALTLFALFSTAVVPIIITALRASSVAKLDTGARNLTQERLEKMRTLPFHTPQAALAGPDLLDTYFTNLTPAASTSVGGLVAVAGSRVEGEPDGAFYRYLVPASEMAPAPETAATFSRYTQRVATQFLNSAGEPFQPAQWNALVSPEDEAVPSFIIRTTVTTTWTAGSLSKSYSVSTNITEGRAAGPIARGEVRASALRITSSVPDDISGELIDLLFEGGVLTIDGQISRGAKVSSSSRGAFASVVPGLRVDGASAGSSSPANSTTSAFTVDPQSLSNAAGPLVRFGESNVLTSRTSADNGQLLAGTPSEPVGAGVRANGDIRFTNQPEFAENEPEFVGPSRKIDTAAPVVDSLSHGASHAASEGWLASTGGSNHNVSAEAKVSTPILGIMPTEFAPEGLLQVQLELATLSCSAGVGSATPSLTYTATVQYWRIDPDTGVEGYAPTPLVLTESSTTDALGALLGTPGDPSDPAELVHKSDAGDVFGYDDYFANLGSATQASLAAERTAGFNQHEASHQGLLDIGTVSMRDGVDAPVFVQFGVLSCLAEDQR